MGRVSHVDQLAAVGDSVLTDHVDKKKAVVWVRAQLGQRLWRVLLSATKVDGKVCVWVVGVRETQPKRRSPYRWDGGAGAVKARLRPYPESDARGRSRTPDAYVRDVVPLTDDQLTDEELARRRHYQETMRRMGIEP